ncbi:MULTISPECIES: hypothetical protein [Streptomyces]|uniref:hypothetical protein n=1 Tax=Streptomyces TaxID=1883 RepID=UPI000F7776C0|nr:MULTISPECIES: hypothetical protein [Streptomyces]RST06133.1 hypothetical protein EF910_10405 [Streptomyces sp. WAC07149]GLX17793.1 hypothetical protein Slala01_14370 [Streptomyces lavendulae subsp. lavendulae]GLX26136.1 hypothetical protein Slala02_19560 [Streptomyces lavendulae subsp. lavendulae]
MNGLFRTAVLTPLAAATLLLGPAAAAQAVPAAASFGVTAAGVTAAGADGDAQYDKGFRKGFQAVKADCGAKPPTGLRELDADYQRGYANGAALAAKTFCGG